jgi:hypothetical protein
MFEAFKFNEQLEAIPTTPPEADYRLRGKVAPGLPEATWRAEPSS